MRFVVTNVGTIERTFIVGVLGVKSRRIEPGETVTITATAPKGTYVVYCDILGHREIGMVATLAVR